VWSDHQEIKEIIIQQRKSGMMLKQHHKGVEALAEEINNFMDRVLRCAEHPPPQVGELVFVATTPTPTTTTTTRQTSPARAGG